jgi:hypothetical protein
VLATPLMSGGNDSVTYAIRTSSRSPMLVRSPVATT